MKKGLLSLCKNRLAYALTGSTILTCCFSAIGATAFSENMGTPSTTTAISANSFQNSGTLTYSGTADVRSSTPSSGYPGASGGGNVFITTTAGTNFQIASINSSLYTAASLSLSFGINKSTTTGTGSDLIVEVSSDGTTYTPLSYPALPTGTGTAIWYLRTATGSIPSTANLRIRFRQTGTATQYRIDDVVLTGTATGASTPPTLVAATGVTVDAPFNITFTDDASWRAATGTVVKVNGTQLTAGFNITAGQITFTPSASALANLLQAAGSKTIVVSKSGYTDASVAQSIGSGIPASLTASTQPTGPSTNGGTLAQQPTVTVKDQYANTVAAGFAVNAAVTSGQAGSWTLGGTASATTNASGVASFSGLTASNLTTNTFTASLTFTPAVGSGSVTSNTFTIPPPPPANDLCGNAISLSVPSGTVSGTLLSSTFISPFAENDVWYSFVPGCNGSQTITVTGFSGDVDIELFQGSCPSTTTTVASSAGITSTETITQSLTAGATYFLRVLAYNNNAAASSSNFTVSVSELCPCPAPIAASSNLSFFGQTATAVSGIFSKASPEPTGGYLVIQSTASSLSTFPSNNSNYTVNANIGTGKVVANITPTGAATYSFSTSSALTGNTQYYYFIIPYNYQSGVCLQTYGNSLVYSNGTFTCPAAPSAPVLSSTTSTSGTFTFTASSVISFDIQWRTSPSGSFTVVNGVTSPYTLTGLAVNTAYDVQVRASNSVCTSVFSSSLTFTTAPLGTPSAIAAITGCDDNFIARWNSLPGATSYQLDVSTSPTFTTFINTADLFISEYVEGSGNNKYIEIYNGTGASVNLGDYRLRLFANGNTTATNDILLSGTLAHGSTVVYKNTSATVYAGTATANAAVNFNGNDAVGLFKVSTNGYVDIFGRIGEDPGSAWTGGGNSTVDKTLVRKATVNGGVTANPSSGFPTLATEWDELNQDDVSNLGTHLHSSPSFVGIYYNLSVSGTSQAVTGLSAANTYYYRVRGTSTNSTSGNSNVVSVSLNSTPAITSCPGSLTFNNIAGQCDATVNYPAAVASGTPAPVIAYSQSSGTIFPLGTTTVTVTATNSCGVATCTFDVTVVDHEPPSITCPSTQTLVLNGSCNASLPDYTGLASVSDNCSSVGGPVGSDITVTQSPAAGSAVSGTGTTLVTLIATDGAGNTNSCQFNVTRIDQTAPTIDNAASSLIVECDGHGNNAQLTAWLAANGGATASDACTGVTWNNNFTGLTSGCGAAGSAIVVFTATDANNNSSSTTATFTIQDNTAPTLSGQGADVTIECSETPVFTAPIASDACDANPSLVSNDVTSPGSCGGNYSVTRTWIATDACGNVSNSVSQTITLVDNTAPTFTAPLDITIHTDANCGFDASTAITGDVTNEADNCSAGLDAAYTDVVVNGPSGAVVYRTWILADACGNAPDAQVQTITVTDITAPAASCKDVTVQLSATGSASISSADVDNNSSDNCYIASLDVSPNTFTCNEVGANPVTLTVTDGAGNISGCNASVTVQDATAPSAACKNVAVQLDALGEATITASQVNNGSSDACGIDALSVSPFKFGCDNLGSNPVTLTVTDVNGNSSSCNASVLVQDKTPAVAICQNVTVPVDYVGIALVTASMINNGSYDACGIEDLSANVTSYTCADLGPHTVTLTVTDNNGNVSTCTSIVTVVDITPPTANCKNATVTLDAAGSASITAADVDNASTDNCGVAGLTVAPSTFGCANIGSNAVTLTVTATNGQTSTCGASVQVVGLVPTCSIAAIPANNTYTGGVPSNIYLGYGPQSVTLKTTVLNGTPQSYAWSGAGVGLLSCTNCASPVFTPLAQGNYTFTVTISNNYGCATSCTITICVLNIVSASGKVYVAHYPSGTLPCVSSACNLLSVSTSAVAAHLAHTCDQLGWCRGGGPQICGISSKDGAEEPAESIAEAGSSEFAVKVYPNPFSSQFRLNVSSTSEENIEVKVFDVLGQLVDSKTNIAYATDFSFGNTLSKGVYLLEVKQGSKTQVLRIVKSE